MAGRVLVTGGAGFIGSQLVRRLVGQGVRVSVIDNLAACPGVSLIEDLLPRIEFCRGDIRSASDLRQLSAGPFETVYHLASSFANQLSVERPELDFETNVEGTRQVVELARERGCQLLVYTGTSSSYGSAPVPFDEDGPMAPQTPYAKNKLLAEEVVRTCGIACATFRLFNVYGPGDYPGRYRNAIPNMMVRASRGEPLRVFGREATRDFSYVDDVIAVLTRADRAAGRVVNIGTGVETPVVTLVEALQRIFAAAGSEISIEAPREWDKVVRRAANVDRLRSLNGWVPATALEAGLQRTATWLGESGYIRDRGP